MFLASVSTHFYHASVRDSLVKTQTTWLTIVLIVTFASLLETYMARIHYPDTLLNPPKKTFQKLAGGKYCVSSWAAFLIPKVKTTPT